MRPDTPKAMWSAGASSTSRRQVFFEGGYIIEDLRNLRRPKSEKVCKLVSQNIYKEGIDLDTRIFPLTIGAKNAILRYKQCKANFIRFKVNFTNAEIDEDAVMKVDTADELSALIPIYSASITLYRFVYLGSEYSIVIFAKITDEDLELNLRHRGHGNLRVGKFRFEEAFIEKLVDAGIEADYSIDTSYGIQIDEQRLIDTVVSGFSINIQYWLVTVGVVLLFFVLTFWIRRLA